MVSGTIGDGTLGLRVASGGLTDLSESHRAYLADRYRLPRPRVALGQGLRGIVHAATDVSDGLIADLGHICEASGLGAQVQAADIPISLAARAVLEGRNGAELADLVTGGDDY